MSEESNPVRCENCREAGGLQFANTRIARCSACGFVLPAPRPLPVSTTSVNLPDGPGVAPGGLLRGKYRLIERLGEGAHGVSYLAEHVYLSHPCVVKVLPRKVG